MKRNITTTSIFLIILLFAFSNCSLKNQPKTDNEKVSELIWEYAKNNIPDYNSFEIIETSDLDSAYTEIFKEKFIHKHAVSYNELTDEIESLQNEIQIIDNYISDIEFDIDNVWSDWDVKSKIVVGKDIDGWNKYWGSTPTGMAYFNKVMNLLDKLEDKKSKAQDKKTQEKKRLKELTKQKQIIKDEIKTFSTNWEKQYIGKSAEVKCRFKNNEGNMTLVVFDVLYNDSLSKIISVVDTIERHSYDVIKEFIIYCNK